MLLQPQFIPSGRWSSWDFIRTILFSSAVRVLEDAAFAIEQALNLHQLHCLPLSARHADTSLHLLCVLLGTVCSLAGALKFDVIQSLDVFHERDLSCVGIRHQGLKNVSKNISFYKDVCKCM